MFSYLDGTLVYVVAYLVSKLIWTIIYRPIDWVLVLRVFWVTANLAVYYFG
jgi:hypothetical protein